MGLPRTILPAALPLLFCAAAGAGQFTLKEGLWAVDRELGNSVRETPETASGEVCMKPGSFDPMRELMLPAACEIDGREESAERLSWTFKCGGGGMPDSLGKASFTTDGDTAQGQMEMTAAYSDQTITIYHKWQGRFLSPQCETESRDGGTM